MICSARSPLRGAERVPMAEKRVRKHVPEGNEVRRAVSQEEQQESLRNHTHFSQPCLRLLPVPSKSQGSRN